MKPVPFLPLYFNCPVFTPDGYKLCRKILNRTNYVRYLGIKIDENLNWKIHIHDLPSKLNWANSVLSKLRYFVSGEVYITLFRSRLDYVCIAWGFTRYP